jgi:hypothetical protein
MPTSQHISTQAFKRSLIFLVKVLATAGILALALWTLENTFKILQDTSRYSSKLHR